MAKAIIISAVTAILCSAICALIVYFLSKNKPQNGNLSKLSLLFGAVSALSAVIYTLAFSLLFNCEALPSTVTVAVITVLCYFGFVGRRFISHEKTGKLLFRLAVLSLIALALESLVFNFKSLSTGNNELPVTLSQAYTEAPQSVQINADSIVFTADGSAVIPVNAENIGAVRLEFSGNDRWVRCLLDIRDGNFQNTFVSAGDKFASSRDGADFTIHAYKNLYEIKVTLNEVGSPVTITECTVSKALPFCFSDLRFLLTLLIMGLICVVVTLGIYKTRYDGKNIKHKVCICAAVALCALMTLFMIDPGQKMIDYGTADISQADPFVQMFDAALNGRVTLDITPSQELLNMENPYDTSLRRAQNVSYAWDRVFYEGEYYSYYGIAPVLVFYFPVYLLTGKLPTLNMTSVFFGALGIIFLCGALLSFVKRYLKEVNLLLLLSLMCGACFASGTYFLVAHSSMYAVPGLAGSCFLNLCLWTGISAAGQEKSIKRYLLFALSGLSLALCVASRPTRAVSALVLIFVFISILLDKKLRFKRKAASAAAFIVPLAAGGIAVMIYNYLRFGSPFDFGAAYQLTVSDVSANKLRLSSLPYAVILYFFQPLQMTGVFPYINFTSISVAGNGMYIYTYYSHGALVYPLLLAGVAVLPFLLYIRRKDDRYKLRKSGCSPQAVKKYTYIIALIIAVLVACVDYCMAGVIFSYICDILPVLCLMSVWVLLDGEKQFTSSGAAAKYTCVCTVIAAATVGLVFLELLTQYNIGIYKTIPDIMFIAEDLLCFWT